MAMGNGGAEGGSGEAAMFILLHGCQRILAGRQRRDKRLPEWVELQFLQSRRVGRLDVLKAKTASMGGGFRLPPPHGSSETNESTPEENRRESYRFFA